MLDHPTRHAPPHMSCGRRWRTGRASGPYSSRRPRGWSALILYGRYGLIGRLSVSPIQIVWGFPPYVLYGQTSAYFQKWTGGGKTTLISVLRTQEIRRHVPFLNWNPHTKYMGPDPHTKSMTHTNCVEFARFLQKCHTKCMGVTQNVLSPHKTHDIFY